MPLKPGDRIERYVIDALLGAGGMGEVYRAHDERLQRSVALKILRVEAADSDGGPPSAKKAERMLREARTAAALDHPNVVAVFDVGQVEEPKALRGTTYIAMELIRGATLRAYIGDASIPVAKRVAWLAAIARALGAAHAAGLVHRDVKPENVMIREDGIIKVLDFGIAKRSVPLAVGRDVPKEQHAPGTLTEEGLVVGTPVYMAPEQMRGESLDGRADQFSWGVLGYELLAGRIPWTRDGGALGIVSQILSATPRSLRGEQGVPVHVAAVVMRALAKDRGARFASMEAVIDALADPARTRGEDEALEEGGLPLQPTQRLDVADQAAIETRTSTIEARAARQVSASTRRWRRVMAAGLVLVLGGTGTVGVWRARRARSGGGVASVGIARGCTSNRACVEGHGGEPYVCRRSDGACQRIASEDCTPMYEPGDLLADDTVWLGAMFPVKGPETAAHGTMNMAGADFARQEIAQATLSFDGASAVQHVRRIALVGCDDSVEAMRAAKHLVEDVGVPAILGFGSGKKLIDIAGSLLIQRGVLTVASLTASPQITQLPQPTGFPRMVWRTTTSTDQMADATAHILESALESRGRSGRTRVTLIRPENTSANLSFAETFYRQLRFNGRTALENVQEYTEITHPLANELSAAEVSALAKRAIETRPTFLVMMGPGSTTNTFLEQVETVSAGRAPTYVIPFADTQTFRDFMGSSADRRRRLFTVNSVSNYVTNARFVIRYNNAHPNHVDRNTNPGVSYDAFYVLAYATLAIGDGEVTGRALGDAIARLVPPGRPIEVGPTDIYAAITELSHGGNIDLQGASSALDFDLKTGEGPSDFALGCSGVDANGEATGEDIESGVVFKAKTRTVEGTIHCP